MKKIHNTFFDALIYIGSIFTSLWWSIWSLFSKKTKPTRQTSLFDTFDYIFRIWPKYFWEKPTGYKIGVFFSSLIRYIFFNTNHKK